MFNFRVDKEIFLFKNGNNSSEIKSGQLLLLLNLFEPPQSQSTVQSVIIVDLGLYDPVKVICQQGLFSHFFFKVKLFFGDIISRFDSMHLGQLWRKIIYFGFSLNNNYKILFLISVSCHTII